jgi:hypothetical protein
MTGPLSQSGAGLPAVTSPANTEDALPPFLIKEIRRDIYKLHTGHITLTFENDRITGVETTKRRSF